MIENICNPRWEEVFYLTAEMLRRSDDLLRLMKARIDGMLAEDEKLQAFLLWVEQKTNSVLHTTYKTKSVTVRCFYTYFGICNLQCSLSDKISNLFLGLNPSLTIGTKLYYNCLNLIELNLASNLNHALVLDSALVSALYGLLPLNNAITLEMDEILRQSLQALNNKLSDNREDFYQWWKRSGKEWRYELRQICINQRNIGHDWQFSDEQMELLAEYYEANCFLIECMNRSSYVSKQVREEIEATMLLPSKK